MGYSVVLDNFEGPLDLLLHLIKEKKMTIEELEVAVITDQYLNYIRQAQEQQLEVMSEYLVMAANLVEMKSRALLPQLETVIEDEYEEDPRQALIRRLIEYKRYKDVLEEFRDKYDQRQKLFVKPANNLEEYAVDTSNLLPNDLQVYDLMQAMQKMFQRIAMNTPLDTHIVKNDITIDQRTEEIKEYLKNKGNSRVKISELTGRKDKIYMIVTFLAILVLAKDNYLAIKQDHLFGDIYVEGNQ